MGPLILKVNSTCVCKTEASFILISSSLHHFYYSKTDYPSRQQGKSACVHYHVVCSAYLRQYLFRIFYLLRMFKCNIINTFICITRCVIFKRLSYYPSSPLLRPLTDDRSLYSRLNMKHVATSCR